MLYLRTNFQLKENNFMYLSEALFYTLLVDYLFLTMATNKFSHKQHLLMHESSVKIWPLALREDVSDERCL